LKPAAFAYIAPTSLQDALSLLQEYGDSAKILAGGQSLVPVLNFRLGRYDHLIDVNRISELSYIRFDGAMLCIGATTRQRAIEVSSLVASHARLLSAATQFVAHLPIRTRGTIGGSLAHADPAAEYPAIMLALDAELVIANAAGSRRVKADDFFVGPMETILVSDELLIEIRIPSSREDQGFAFEEISRRKGDFALVGVAAAVTLNRRTIETVRLAVCGLEAAASRLTGAEEILRGAAAADMLQVNAEVLLKASRAAAESAAAQDDLHATAEYRRHLIETLVQRVIRAAISDASDNK